MAFDPFWKFPDSGLRRQGGGVLASGWDIQGPPRAENGATQKLHFLRFYKDFLNFRYFLDPHFVENIRFPQHVKVSGHLQIPLFSRNADLPKVAKGFLAIPDLRMGPGWPPNWAPAGPKG